LIVNLFLLIFVGRENFDKRLSTFLCLAVEDVDDLLRAVFERHRHIATIVERLIQRIVELFLAGDGRIPLLERLLFVGALDWFSGEIGWLSHWWFLWHKLSACAIRHAQANSLRYIPCASVVFTVRAKPFSEPNVSSTAVGS